MTMTIAFAFSPRIARAAYHLCAVRRSGRTTRIDIAIAYNKRGTIAGSTSASSIPQSLHFRRDRSHRLVGRLQDEIHIATDSATPGYLHGEIRPAHGRCSSA